MPASSGLLSSVLDRPTLSPMHRATEWRRAEVSSAPAAARPQAIILVVDENTWLLELLGRLLTTRRYRCALAQDRQRAWSWLAGQPPALVILDWRMREASAAEVVSTIRKFHGATVPILAIAPLADADAVQCAGADAFLRRPFFAKDLIRMASALLDC